MMSKHFVPFGKNFNAKGVLGALLVALGVACPTTSALAQSQLVLWNKLGSTTEVQNSEIGADFGIHSDAQGGVQFVPGQFGNALATTGGTTGSTGGYLTMGPNDFYPSDRRKGSVEVWIQKRIQQFVPFQTPLVNIFGHVPHGGGNRGIFPVWANALEGGVESGMEFLIEDNSNINYRASDIAWNNVPVGQWVHMAFVWDLDGIDGTTDRMRIYRDGVVVATNTDNIPNILNDSSEVRVLGHHEFARFGQPTAYLDNIKVWNCAKTDFSDRFEEGANRGCTIEVPVDIKAESCPNPLNCKSRGTLPVAILGTEDFDVIQIDPASIRLEGVAPQRTTLEDVATPFVPFVGKEDCFNDCTADGPDGFLDLTLKFDTQEVLAALGEVEDETCLVLTLTGELADGTPFVGEDVVRILCK